MSDRIFHPERCREQLQTAAEETFMPNPDFPFGFPENRLYGDLVIKGGGNQFTLSWQPGISYRQAAYLVSYTAKINFDTIPPRLTIRIRWFVWAWIGIMLLFSLLCYYLDGQVDVFFLLLALFGWLHLSIRKRKFRRKVLAFLNSL